MMKMKRFVAMMLALLMMFGAAGACAEGGVIATPTDLIIELPAEEPAAEEEIIAEEPAAEEEIIAEEPAAEEEIIAEEPAAEEEIIAEEPAAEEEIVAEEPAAEEEIVAEEPAAEEEIIAEEPAEEAISEEPVTEEVSEEEVTEEEITEEPAIEEEATEEEATEEEVTTEEQIIEVPEGSIRIRLLNQGQLYYGDSVTLVAVIENVDCEYNIVWQVLDGSEWKDVAHGAQYTFTLTEANANLQYRVVLTTIE